MQSKSRLKILACASFLSFIFTGLAQASTNRGVSALREGDCATALKELLPSAKSGDIKAENILGKVYSEGCDNFPANPGLAAHWYLRAAEKGDAEAQHVIAGMYAHGTGVPADMTRAFKWWRKSAAHGNGTDLTRLSEVYEKGEIVPRDRVLTYTLRALAGKVESRSGDESPDEYLAYYADNMSPDQLAESKRLIARWKPGMAIPATSKTGRLLPSAWYRKAADAGDAQALYKLGLIYLNNLEDSADEKKARLYLRAAAEKGHAGAQEALAKIYRCGECGPADYVLSYVLSTLSVKDKGAREKARVSEMWDDNLTPEQIAEAKALISGWKIGMAFPEKTQTGHLRKVNYAESAKAKQEATPEVRQLFAAANEGDESTFDRLIESIPNINDYVVDGNTLLHALLLPAKSLRDDEVKWLRKNQDKETDAHMQAQRLIHLATLPAKTRMLALALQHGASVNEGSFQYHAAPLHLATVFGSPEMVTLLLQHGADPNQYGGANYQDQPVEFSLALMDSGTNLPELVTPEQRTKIIVELLHAGAKMPYMSVDRAMEKEEKKPVARPAADYLLWNDLVSLTVGSEVLTLMEKTGTTPAFDDSRSALAYAAQAGNIEAVRWLKSRLPNGDKGKALLVEAAMWAMYGNPASADAVLNELVVAGMPWDRTELPREESATRHHRPLSLPPPPDRSATLLGHAVLTHRYDWVRKLIQLGAPINGISDLNDSPLTLAVASGDVKMVKLLLDLGADPLAEDERSPLMRAITPDDPPSNNTEITTLLLNRAIQQQQPMSDAFAQKWMGRVLSRGNDDDITFAVIKALVEGGFSPNKLSPRNLAYAIQLKNRGIIDYLIAHGALKPNDGSALPAAYSVLFNAAIFAQRDDLLPVFLAAGLDPNINPGDWKVTPFEYAIRKGDVSAVNLFAQKYGVPKDATQHEWGTVLDLAVASRSEEILKTVTDNFSIRLDHACVPDTAMLLKTILDSSESYWSALLQHGFGSKPGECTTMIDRLLQALVKAPNVPQVGWVGAQLTQRLKDLSDNGTRLNAAVSTKTHEQISRAGRQDVLQSLQAAGWASQESSAPVKAAPQVMSSAPKDIALGKKLPGHYYLEHVTEVGSELVLSDDGHFSYFLSYGAFDQFAAGTWQVVNGAVIFRSTKPPAKDQYQLVSAKPSSGSSAVVSVIYQQRAISRISITLLGDRGMKATGLTTEQGFISSLVGPIRQIVLFHPDMNKGRAFVYTLSAAEAADRARNFVFELLPSKTSGVEFNSEMRIQDGDLVWKRDDQDFRYRKQR